MTPANTQATAEQIISLVEQSFKALGMTTDGYTMQIIALSDTESAVILSDDVIVYCLDTGEIMLDNAPHGKWQPFGNIPVMTPLNARTFALAIAYLLDLRQYHTATIANQLTSLTPTVDISPLVSPTKLIS